MEHTTNILNKRNIKLVIAYQGTRYCGWQRQKDDLTVQGTIEKTLSDFLGSPVRIQGASRTDAGVHAEGQTANFKLENCPIPTENFKEILNVRLPADIAIRSCENAPMTFHASRDAVSKTYLYTFYTNTEKDVFHHNHRWAVEYRLNPILMNEAAKFLIGTHDVLGFTSAKDERENSIRTIFEASVFQADPDEIHFTIRANRFLYLMVRNIAGTLVEIGRGRFHVAQMTEILARRDRTLAGPTAPPQGLCLKVVEYSKNVRSTLDFDACSEDTE
jgi:tRNA pseudouridine38-40 synthase